MTLHHSWRNMADMVTDCSSTDAGSSNGGANGAGDSVSGSSGGSVLDAPVQLFRTRHPADKERPAGGARRRLWRPQTAPWTPSVGCAPLH